MLWGVSAQKSGCVSISQIFTLPVAKTGWMIVGDETRYHAIRVPRKYKYQELLTQSELRTSCLIYLWVDHRGDWFQKDVMVWFNPASLVHSPQDLIFQPSGLLNTQTSHCSALVLAPHWYINTTMAGISRDLISQVRAIMLGTLCFMFVNQQEMLPVVVFTWYYLMHCVGRWYISPAAYEILSRSRTCRWNPRLSLEFKSPATRHWKCHLWLSRDLCVRWSKKMIVLGRMEGAESQYADTCTYIATCGNKYMSTPALKLSLLTPQG